MRDCCSRLEHAYTASVLSIIVKPNTKMVRKKIDNRIRVMIENGVKLGHRTMFLLVGDKARDQVSTMFINI